MKPIFIKEPSLQLRFFLVVIAAIFTIFADSRLRMFTKIRPYMDTVISPFYFLIRNSHQILDNILQTLTTHSQLASENRILRHELLLMHSKQLLVDQYKQENAQLRGLLRSPLRQDERKMVTRVISTSTDPYNKQIVIDKGINDGVYIGQPVISDQGVIGQVIATNNFTSRVLLICDTSHALPIQVLRNNVRIIVTGNGYSRYLHSKSFPSDIDIRVGDMLVTSGLGGRFPEGYPVAIVSSIILDTQHACVIIQARPTASLQHLSDLLLLWNRDPSSSDTPLPTDEVRKRGNERLMKIAKNILPHNTIRMPLSNNIN